jgi:predicted lactoylglutathione lyase
MNLGTFSVSLTVKDIAKSKAFYEVLGFKALEGCGSIEDKWLIMKQEQSIIGLFEGMFDHNIMTFNPTDAREVEKHLLAHDIVIDAPTSGESGPTHCILKDPDGNVIMFDQH